MASMCSKAIVLLIAVVSVTFAHLTHLTSDHQIINMIVFYKTNPQGDIKLTPRVDNHTIGV